jgi:CRP-like cAMP-binding protein
LISPEKLRKYPHCAGAPDELLKKVAMLGKEQEFNAGDRLFSEGQTADHLLFLESGQIDIVFSLGNNKHVTVDTLITGDMLAWSSLLEPFTLTASGVAKSDGVLIKIDAAGLREICEENPSYGFFMMRQVATTLRERLTATRVQLAGMSSPA